MNPTCDMIEYENLHKLNKPFFTEYLNQFNTVLESGQFILGTHTKSFEKEFAAYCGSRYSVGVANGLDALVIALKAFGFKEGSEVIVPSNTYIATILAIINCNLKPVLVEPRLSTYNINPDEIENAITRKTVAIMVVHLYGKLCEMQAINKIASQHGLKVIEDCAQAHGASFHERKAGTFGDVGAFSFYPTKNLGALGDGGGLTTEDPELFRKFMLFRNYGSDRKYYNEIPGINSRLDEVQASFLRIKLQHLDRINIHKQELATLYTKGLKSDFIKPVIQMEYTDVFHIYNVRHAKRDELKKHLEHNGIKTEIHYPIPPHKQEALKGLWDESLFPIAEEIHSTTLSLPISFFHTSNDILRVIEIMNNF